MLWTDRPATEVLDWIQRLGDAVQASGLKNACDKTRYKTISIFHAPERKGVLLGAVKVVNYIKIRSVGPYDSHRERTPNSALLNYPGFQVRVDMFTLRPGAAIISPLNRNAFLRGILPHSSIEIALRPRKKNRFTAGTGNLQDA